MIAERSDREPVRALAWLLVLGFGLWLRFWQLHLQILIDDEWHALHRLMTADFRQIFLSLGHADHSIPLTLLFKALAQTIGLQEWHMRALPLAAGCASIVVIPRLLAAWLGGYERLLLGALIAISPLLVHFSRYARPYALVVLLGLVAVIVLWHWWHEGGRGRAVVFALCAVVAAWLHPLSALFTGAALTWFGLAGLKQGLIELRWRPLGRLLLLGGVTTAVCCALLLPPILSDPWSIAAKAGMDRPDWITLVRAWELILGTAGNPVALIGLALAGIGAWQLWRRDRYFLLYWAWMLAAVLVVIFLLEPAWIQNALVLVRYSAIAQPLVLALVALGAAWIPTAVGSSWGPTARSVAFVIAAGLVWGHYLAGPFPQLYRGLNQFTNAARYQVDYDFERSVYHDLMSSVRLPEIYARMAAEPGDWEIVETPWYFESNNTAISEYQRIHQIPIRIGMIGGLCSDWTWGELDPHGGHEIELARFVFLSDLLEQGPSGDRFVVFHRQRPFEHSRELTDVEPCIRSFEDRFGSPWHESDDFVVFRLPGSAPADDA
jgi:hypothetical protein